MPMRIVYIGDYSPETTSGHRARALQRIGHDVEVWDPMKVLSTVRRGSLLRKLHELSGQVMLAHLVRNWLAMRVRHCREIDAFWINGGELVARNSLQLLRRMSAPIIVYNNDDPTGPRDGRRFQQLRKSLSSYDLCVTLRDQTCHEMKQLGAKRVVTVPFSYDEVAHRPIKASECVREEFCSEVTFVGTWMRGEGRENMLSALHKAGCQLRIWGNSWGNSLNRELVGQCWQGRTAVGRDYVHAVVGAKIAIGMVSKGNRDEHTSRSLEIPYAGGLLCAERTSEHLRMFKDGEEAVFWSSPEECVQVCRDLLANEARRRAIVANGMRKVRELKVGNEDVCRGILEELPR
jgi:hypothetical protein